MACIWSGDATRPTPEAVAGYATMWARDELADLASVVSPLLAITGEDDHEDMRGEVAGRAPALTDDLSVCSLKGGGPSPMKDMPQLFAAVLERFPMNSEQVHQPAAPREEIQGTRAYLVVQGTIVDEDGWREYAAAVVPLIASFGGRHVSKGGGAELLEGHHADRRTALFEFPSMEAVRAFWDSPEYVPVKELRRNAATLEIWAVPGT